MRRFLALFVAVCSLSACAQATEIVLVVDTDLMVPSELTRIEIDVLNSMTTPTRTSVDLSAAGAPPLPLTLGITSRVRANADVRVEVRGYLETGEILVRDVSTSLGPGSSRMLRVLLARRCLTTLCSATETCDETGCRSVTMAPEELPPWTGSAMRQDGDACTPGEETCNLTDDDCDDVIDETTERLTDAMHCGRCGHACTGGACENGFCPGERPVAVSAGGAHTCVRREAGGVSCFGWNAEGQLGSSRLNLLSAPLEVPSLTGVSAIGAGGAYGCVIDARDQLLCVGDGDDGALGRGNLLDGRTYTAAMGSTGFDHLSTGPRHACAIDVGGNVLCWGFNGSGQTGSAGEVLSPTIVPTLTGATAVGAGLDHACAVVSGSVYCWGSNTSGQLGNAMTVGSSVAPVLVDGITTATELALGRDFSCALLMDGHVRCWGSNREGQLGATTAMTTSVASVEVTGLMGVTEIAAASGGTHACALRSGGLVSCWGSNASGQLGNGLTTPTTTPVDLMNVTGAVSVAAGGLSADGRGHTCVVLGSGEVRCAGDGTLGQTGSATLAATSMGLLPVPGLP